MNPVLILKIGVRIVQRFTMRFIVGFKPMRELVTKLILFQKRPRPILACKSEVFESFSKPNVNKSLAEKGFAEGISVSDEQVQEILNFCKRNNAILGLKDQVKVKRKEIYISVDATKAPLHSVPYYYYYDVHNKCEAVRDIVFNEDLLSVARNYLGAEPTLLFSNIIWTFPVAHKGVRVGEVGQFGFHFDIPDFKSLAVFVYLNDVDEDCGPHVVIEGTHRRKPLKSLIVNTLGHKEALKKYSERIKVFTGKRGTTVVEDIYSYHKATNPIKPRLALKFFYGIQRSTMIHNRDLRDVAKSPVEKNQQYPYQYKIRANNIQPQQLG